MAHSISKFSHISMMRRSFLEKIIFSILFLCFCWDINWCIGRRPRYRTKSHSCGNEVDIKLFNKGSHKIVQDETESLLKKYQVWTPLFSYMFSSQVFGFTSKIFMKLKVHRIESTTRILVSKNLYWQFDNWIFRGTVIYAW